MSRTVRSPWARAWTLALLGLLGAWADARPARAMGCHVADRPTLGLPSPGAEPVLGVETVLHLEGRPAAQVVPRPCTGDVPDSSGHPLSLWAIAERAPAGWVAGPRASRLTIEPPRLVSRLGPVRVDRPPRPSPALV